MKLKTTSENDVKKIVKKWFDDRSGFSYAPQQGGMGKSGIPDRVGCIPTIVTQEMVGQTIGLFVAIEAKAPGRRGQKNAGVSGLQTDCLLEISGASGVAYVVDCERDLETVDNILRDIRNRYTTIPNALANKLLKDRIKYNG